MALAVQSLRDVLLVIWWAFILWLLVTSMKESRPTDSKVARDPTVDKSRLHSSYERGSYERGCQEKKLLPAPLGDAEVVTYIQPHLIPHLILRGVIGLVALARRTSPRRCQPQLLVPTRRFHEVSGARRRSVAKLRKLSVGVSANHDPM
jgi:hypothetical protein